MKTVSKARAGIVSALAIAALVGGVYVLVEAPVPPTTEPKDPPTEVALCHIYVIGNPLADAVMVKGVADAP